MNTTCCIIHNAAYELSNCSLCTFELHFQITYLDLHNKKAYYTQLHLHFMLITIDKWVYLCNIAINLLQHCKWLFVKCNHCHAGTKDKKFHKPGNIIMRVVMTLVFKPVKLYFEKFFKFSMQLSPPSLNLRYW